MRLTLTDAQARLFRFIEREIRAGRRAPTFAEMAAYMGFPSKSGVHRLIAALEERGWIVRMPNRARAIALAPGVADYTVRLTPEIDDLLHRHIAGWASTPEAVIAAAVVEYLGRRAV